MLQELEGPEARHSTSPSSYSTSFRASGKEEDEIEETPLTCTICQDTYSDPRVLPCLHSFCKGCLSKLASISTSIKCPLCRNEHTLSPKGVDELLPNTQLARKVETLSTTTEKLKCDQCESDETDVVSFCSYCESYLCKSCDGAHKKMLAFKSHELVLPKLAKKNPKVKSFMCPKHTSEALSVYCAICKSVICRDCAIYNHNGHRFEPAMDVSDKIKRFLVSDSKQLKTKLETFHSHAEEVAKIEKHVTVYPDEMKSFITSQFEELHKLLDKRKEVLLQQVDTQYNDFSKLLWIEKDIVETGICKLEAGIRFAQQLAKSDDKLEVAVLGSKALASNRVTKTLSWNPKSIQNLGPLAYDADFDKRCIEKIGIINNIEVVISDGKYSNSLRDFQENGTYCIEIEVKFGHHPKISFPQMNFQCSCRRGDEVLSCTTYRAKLNKWDVTFQTKYSGDYTLEAVLKICHDDCHRKSKLFCIPESSSSDSASPPPSPLISALYTQPKRTRHYERRDSPCPRVPRVKGPKDKF
ncbi:PREDICTED: tripartite motif-containing protein 45-like [Amphimedon queenslandica]|uniref:RING-type E3 ubiquitin transferase n=1 Tax=Amphimedon queenslandica TaxID=400682 RepID=A0AAN0JSF4_AMPQE|nr:PREDICTED: tripartite motif-containing protein 45-like [Amphimedon queenslandica]|eukprot:XP_019859746.1 PREDICTED: tripartite motif-containing protein 45-like [Amphimedon queenslandica]